MIISCKKIIAPENLKNKQKIWNKFSAKHIIKMNTKAIRELKSIAKDKGLRGFYKPKKADLLALLLEQSSRRNAYATTEGKWEGRKACTSCKDNLMPSRNEKEQASGKK